MWILAIVAICGGLMGGVSLLLIARPPLPVGASQAPVTIVLGRPLRVALAAAMAVLFTLIALWRGEPASAADVILTSCCLFYAVVSLTIGVIDAHTHRIPDLVVLPSALVMVVCGALAWWEGAPLHVLLGSVLGALLCGLLFALMRLTTNGALGGGDVKLVLLTGAASGLFGAGAVVVGLGAAFLMGGVWSAVVLVRNRGDRKRMIAFGPFLLIGSWIGIIAGSAAIPAVL